MNLENIVEFIDSHCHIDFEQFDEDRDKVLETAAQFGVRRLINPGVDLENSQQVVALAQRYPNLYAAVGFHPNHVAPDGVLQVDDESLAGLRRLAADRNVVAIGEIGLDYYWDRAPKSVQIEAFEAQLALAKSLQLPVIIHQREAAEDTMAILRRWGASGDHPGLVLHAFSGDEALVEEAVSLGFYIGIGGPVTFKNVKDLPDVVQTIPLDRLLIETDAPFLSPHPYRGKRNEPGRVVLVAEKLAELFDLDVEVLAARTTKNTESLFHLPNLK